MGGSQQASKTEHIRAFRAYSREARIRVDAMKAQCRAMTEHAQQALDISREKVLRIEERLEAFSQRFPKG